MHALIQLGATATQPELLVTTALPLLRDVTRADSVMVVTRTAEGHEVRANDGMPLSVDGIDLPAERAGLVPLEPPDGWAAAGARTAVAQVLPGHAGVLVYAWAAEDAAEDVRLLESATAVLDGALARIEAEEKLADLTQRVDNAQHLAGMGDYDWHIPTDTNRWSDQLYRIYGYEPQSFNASYERFLGNIHPEDRERIQAIHQKAYATGEPYQMIERIVRPDGEVRYLSSNGEVIMDASGVPVRMRGTCIDVTERILAERATEQAAERFRGLVESSPDAILVLDADATIQQANGRAAALLGADPAGHSLDEVLPPDCWSGAQGVDAKTLDGQPLVLDVTTAELTESNHERHTAVFLTDASPRLEREAMATRLGESHQRRRQALEINDNVVQGLTSAIYSLEQDDVARAASYIERTLAAARDMMDDLLEPSGEELHPGDLVRSSPANLDASPRTAPATEPERPSGRSAHRVLIVDDAEDIRTLLRLKLGRHEGFEVVGEAVDGVDAVDQARALQPHLVLLDMAMPRMDGLQALPLIREAVPDVRVVVLSGFNQRTLEQEALAAGADRYVVKGGSMRELVDLIEKLLDVA
ncbi:MAG TPA: response regulator [Marmoricola sp.]|nr:response regulator [Marmoricola sp.]